MRLLRCACLRCLGRKQWARAACAWFRASKRGSWASVARAGGQRSRVRRRLRHRTVLVTLYGCAEGACGLCASAWVSMMSSSKTKALEIAKQRRS
ncbi:uncharacterized protein M421DRAFT_317547 [Didymella exigua CBS 183.55]|uniref:Uncharacterized protein n=1 Tax=Didymella exigua CBS 183.55 TaxID=1150837 RepID=A0A6A5RVU7_9PLEO|nr:uncharacterized protein M421DRAFT_317547 [Didymella exigua CBS 183.55]KAF1931663.1 hypothetical protein M421DRAFT_317547 [Didymella exigua CBS 183.55]